MNIAQELQSLYPWPEGWPRDYKAPHAPRPPAKRPKQGGKKRFRLFKGWRP